MRSPRLTGRAFWVALVLVVLASGSEDARGDAVRTGDRFPTRGRPTLVFVEASDGTPAAGAEVSAVYRPGSEVPHAECVGVTDGVGRVSWTPVQSGIVCLTAAWTDSAGRHASQCNVSVRFDRVRAEGVIVAILAGMILYGTVAYGFGRLRS